MKISVITAVFNCRDTIDEALASVASQDYPDVQHVVIDGGSTDGTLQALERQRSRIDVLVSEKDGGIYDALNKGIALSVGEAIGFLHADDLLADERVLSRIAAALSRPGVEAVYGDLVYVRRKDPGRVVRYWRAGEFAPAKLCRGWMPPHPTLYVKREVYERLGHFDTSMRIAADYDCILRFFGRGGVRPAYVPEVLVKMRLGGTSNCSLSGMARKSCEDYRALRKNGIGGLGALAWKNVSKVGQFFR